MNVCTVILGAGKGSRMKSIIPKPFHKVANLKLIDWILNTHNSIKIDKKIIKHIFSAVFGDVFFKCIFLQHCMYFLYFLCNLKFRILLHFIICFRVFLFNFQSF